jgi:glycosyltransferase involved in cell wall biosynthesis
MACALTECTQSLRIGYLIGDLRAGGSERQLSELAVSMASRGHTVEVACYDGGGHFDSYVEAGGAKVNRMNGGNKVAKVLAIRRWIDRFQPNILHGFMKRASSLAVLANLPRRRCKVVASDYSTASYARQKWDLWASLVLWSFADRVATQTEMNRRSLCLLGPWLKGKVVIVRNGVETDRFSPEPRRRDGNAFRFLAVGTVYGLKNPTRVVEATRILREKTDAPFRLEWAGSFARAGVETQEYRQAVDLIQQYRLSDVVRFLGGVDQIQNVYRQADCLVHVSLQEGMPNAVVEAMSCGLPVIVGDVSDLPLVVKEANNGYVCDQTDPQSIAVAMQSAMELGGAELREMGSRSRRLAVRWFGRERFADEYEGLYTRLLEETRSDA